MLDEITPKSGDGIDTQLERQGCLKDLKIAEEENIQFPSEMLNDFSEDIIDEKNFNLYQELLKMNLQQKTALASIANLPTRRMLIQSPNKVIALSVLKNPKLMENEVLKYAQQRNLIEDVLVAISKHPKWMKNYQIKSTIVTNPKTPLPIAINFLSHLQDKDLKSLSRDKNISTILSRAAYQTMRKRSR